MTALLKDALKPNLVQTLENNPALIHGGPFANIAHGCNSVRATKLALKLADYTITEAGFGSDLGAEKFFDIKCRYAGLKPSCVVLVATVRALKYNGGVPKTELTNENVEALEKGIVNLKTHIENMHKFGVPVVVAINRFHTDTEAELAVIEKVCGEMGVEFSLAEIFAKGSEGGIDLAEKVCKTIETKPSEFKPLYDEKLPIKDKLDILAKEILSIILVLFVLPQILLIGTRIVDRTSFAVPKLVARSSGNGRMRVNGIVQGEIHGSVAGTMNAIVDGDVQLTVISGNVSQELDDNKQQEVQNEDQ